MGEQWMTAEGVCITKEQSVSTNIASEFRTFRRENLFLSHGLPLDNISHGNGYINTSVQEGGIPGVFGCLEHATMI